MARALLLLLPAAASAAMDTQRLLQDRAVRKTLTAGECFAYEVDFVGGDRKSIDVQVDDPSNVVAYVARSQRTWCASYVAQSRERSQGI